MPTPADITQLAAECAVLTATAINKTAEAALALAEAAIKCQELEDCLNADDAPAPVPIPFPGGRVAPVGRGEIDVQAMSEKREAMGTLQGMAEVFIRESL